MELLNHLDTIVIKGIELAWNTVVGLNVGDLDLARRDLLITNSPAAADARSLLEVVGILASVVFGGILSVAVAGKRSLSKPKESPTAVITAVQVQPTGALKGKWDAILGHLDSPHENDWKLAVIEADKLVDSAMQQAGFPGDTFGDRLTNIEPGALISLDGLWWAHRIRNRVAHELDYFLRYTEARQAVSYFQATMEELKLI